MPSAVALGPIYGTIKSLLAASGSLTALISTKAIGGGPAIYDEGSVPQTSTMPYLTIGLGTQIPWHTMGEVGSLRYGWNCTLQIKAVGQGSEASGLAILGEVAAVLYDGRELNVPGYGSSWCEEFNVEPTLVTVSAGVTTREWPAIVRVLVHDSL